MKAPDDVPELAHALGTGFDQPVAAGLAQPARDHGIVARDHVRIVEPGDVIGGVHQGAFLCEGERLCGALDFGELHDS